MKMAHYHIWLRSGTAFHLRPKAYNTRAAAHKAAALLRAAPADRLVLVCESCPRPVRARRRSAVRWRDIARAAGLPAAAATRLKAAYGAERRRVRGEAPDSPAANASPTATAAPAGPDASPAEARAIMQEIKRATG